MHLYELTPLCLHTCTHMHACMHVLTYSDMWHAKQKIIMAKYNIEERLNIELLHIVKRTMEWLLLPRVYFTWSGLHNWLLHSYQIQPSLTGLYMVATQSILLHHPWLDFLHLAVLVLMCYLLVTSFRTHVLWRTDIACLSLFILHLNFS